MVVVLNDRGIVCIYTTQSVGVHGTQNNLWILVQWSQCESYPYYATNLKFGH